MENATHLDEVRDPLLIAEAWAKGGRDVAIATVVETWGSAPRPVGAQLAVSGDAELQHARLARADHVDGLAHHRALHAAARNGAFKIPLAVNHQMAADRTRRRAPGLHDGGQRHLPALAAPALGRGQHVEMRIDLRVAHGIPLASAGETWDWRTASASRPASAEAT